MMMHQGVIIVAKVQIQMVDTNTTGSTRAISRGADLINFLG